jgi:hypothetical protein
MGGGGAEVFAALNLNVSFSPLIALILHAWIRRHVYIARKIQNNAVEFEKSLELLS